MPRIPVCDFCGGPDRIIVAYPVGEFSMMIAEDFASVVAAQYWAACAECKRLVDADRLGDLVERCVRMYALRSPQDKDAAGRAGMKRMVRTQMSHVLRLRQESIPDSEVPENRRSRDDRPMGTFFGIDTKTGEASVTGVAYPMPPHPLRTETKGAPDES